MSESEEPALRLVPDVVDEAEEEIEEAAAEEAVAEEAVAEEAVAEEAVAAEAAAEEAVTEEPEAAVTFDRAELKSRTKAQLMALAEEHGIVLKKSWNKSKMLDVLCS